MLSLARGGGRLPLKAFAVALGLSVLAGTSVLADVDGHGDHHEGRFKHGHLGYGTLGWAPYGLYPGPVWLQSSLASRVRIRPLCLGRRG